MPVDLVELSRFLSFVLRHQPDSIGLVLDQHGWARIDELINRANAAATRFTRGDLLRVLDASGKRRFMLSEDGLRIRAVQGHSLSVDLGLSPQDPPAHLYHGTASRFLESIRFEGLKAQGRQHVHLSMDMLTAWHVGRRHGQPVVLKVQALRMSVDGFLFYRAQNGVWLTDYVPPKYLD